MLLSTLGPYQGFFIFGQSIGSKKAMFFEPIHFELFRQCLAKYMKGAQDV